MATPGLVPALAEPVPGLSPEFLLGTLGFGVPVSYQLLCKSLLQDKPIKFIVQYMFT